MVLPFLSFNLSRFKSYKKLISHAYPAFFRLGGKVMYCVDCFIIDAYVCMYVCMYVSCLNITKSVKYYYDNSLSNQLYSPCVICWNYNMLGIGLGGKLTMLSTCILHLLIQFIPPISDLQSLGNL